MIPTQFEAKAAWKRPENWVTWLPLVAAGLLVMKFANPLLEFIADFAQNGIIAVASLAGLALVVFLAMNADLHKLLALAWTSAAKRMTNVVYAVYPLEIMEGYLDDLKEKKKRLKKALGDLRGLLTLMIERLTQKGVEHTEAMTIARAASQHGNQPGMQAQMAFQARRADRLEKRGITAQGRINKVKNLIALMAKVDEATDYMILDLADTIKNEREEREEAEKTAATMKAAEAILFNNQKREEFDKALEANQQYVSMQMGLLKQFEEDTKNIITGIDLENDVIKLEALEKIDQMGKKLDGLFQGGTGTTKYRVSPVFRIEDDDDAAVHEQAELEQQEAEAQAEPKAKRQSFADLYKHK